MAAGLVEGLCCLCLIFNKDRLFGGDYLLKIEQILIFVLADTVAVVGIVKEANNGGFV